LTRRDFFAAHLLLVALVAQTALAQSKPLRIGYLGVGSDRRYINIFAQELRALGFSERDLTIDNRFAGGHSERLRGLAAELVQLAPKVIVAGSSQAAKAAKEVTSTIPIVMVGPGDPVAVGLVQSLPHPGGNVTGFSVSAGPEIGSKWVELLHDLASGTHTIGMLINPATLGHPSFLAAAQDAARDLRLEIVSGKAAAPEAIDSVIGQLSATGAQALIVPADPLFLSNRGRIVEFVGSRKLPVIYGAREFCDAGGLISYGADLKDLFRRAAAYVDKILKGVKPADLPVEQPTRFELVINLKTAKALGLTVPPALLARADEVIE
jgi:putative ABC transport system substrate-binding protein